MTGQDLLTLMEDVHRELQTQSGEVDVTRALRLLNTAQDYFETLVALIPRAYGSGTGTVTTAASTETTAFPAGLLRVDALWLLDTDGSLPVRKLYDIDGAGGHQESNLPWPLEVRLGQTTGAPRGAFIDGTNIYWDPLPDSTRTIRWYGLQRASDITAVGTFTYDDGVALPLALFAVELIRRGLDDPVTDYIEMANQIFQPELKRIKKFRRVRAPGRQYQMHHDT